MPAKLYVPVNFGQLAYDWSAPSSSQPAISDAEMAKLQDCLTIFIEAMLRGVIVQLRIDENETGRQGCNLLAVVALPSSLEELVIISGGLEQTIRMSCIRWVRPLEKGRRTGSCLWPGSERQPCRPNSECLLFATLIRPPYACSPGAKWCTSASTQGAFCVFASSKRTI